MENGYEILKMECYKSV